MNCPSGHSNADGMIFCTQCGMKIATSAPLGYPQHHIQQNNPTNPFDAVAPMWPNAETQYQPISQLPKNNTGRNIAIVSVISTLVIVAFAFFVMSNRTTEPETRSVTVSLTVMNDLDGCDLPFGYFDIPGAQFELRADGVVVGFGSYPQLGENVVYGCKFSSVVYDVPADADSYSVSLASGKRGTIYNTRADLAGNNWEFSLSLGDS